MLYAEMIGTNCMNRTPCGKMHSLADVPLTLGLKRLDKQDEPCSNDVHVVTFPNALFLYFADNGAATTNIMYHITCDTQPYAFNARR